MADTNISGSTSRASAYSRTLTRVGLDALGGLVAEAPETGNSRVFRLGPLSVRLETQAAAPAPAAHEQITEAARHLADQVRAFNFKEEMDAGACYEALADHEPDGMRVRQGSRGAHEEALDALDGLIETAPQRTPAAVARAYGVTERRARGTVPRMINAQV